MSEKHSTRTLVQNLAVSPTNSVSIEVVDPYTWAWVGEKLAEGIIAWIGAQLFSQLVGNIFGGNSVSDVLTKMVEGGECGKESKCTWFS